MSNYEKLERKAKAIRQFEERQRRKAGAPRKRRGNGTKPSRRIRDD